MIALWMLVPTFALICFLAISVWHFAGDWETKAPLVVRLVVAGAVIVLPCLCYSAEVGAIFALLIRPDAAVELAAILRIASAFWLAAFLICCLYLCARQPWAALEALSLGMSALLLPPLLHFVPYFCGLHSPRHLTGTYKQLGLTRPKQILRALGPTTMVTCLMAFAAYYFVRSTDPSGGILRIVFIGLAALTVPHMLVIKAHNRSTSRSAHSDADLVKNSDFAS